MCEYLARSPKPEKGIPAQTYKQHVSEVMRMATGFAEKAAVYSAAAMRVDPPADYADLIADAAEDDARNAAAEADDRRVIRMETFA